MAGRIEGRVLYPGTARGTLLRLGAPLSLWGGVDPLTGCIVLGSHPERGKCVAGTVLALAEPIGSSSSSSVLLKLIRNGVAPAALLLGRPDAILIVGCLVARELGLAPPPVVVCPADALGRLPDAEVSVAEGVIVWG
jgi:predicted aconitase with swiveling domain